MDSSMTFRIDSQIKEQMTEICNQLGMTPSTAINLFVNAFVREKGMPFQIKLKTNEKALTKEQTCSALLHQIMKGWLNDLDTDR